MHATAICISCGEEKRMVLGACDECGFIPDSLSDKARSLVLSLNYQVQTNEYGNDDRSKPWPELQAIGRAIAAGQAYDFSKEPMDLVEKQVQFLGKLTPGKVLIDALVWLAPLLAAVFVVLLLLR